MKKKVDLILACSDLGVHVDGSRMGPEILCNNINKEDVNNIKIIKQDYEYVKEKNRDNKKKNIDEINRVNEEIYNEVRDSLNNDSFPILIGGDHSVVIGSSLASIEKYENMGIIWFDSHADFHTFDTTETGNIHGLPFAAITGYEKRNLSQFQNKKNFNFKNAVLFGARDIDRPYEFNNLIDAGVTIITTEDIKKYGMEVMCKKAFDIVTDGTNGVHISLDIDSLDPEVAPGVSVPVKDGLNLDELNCFIDYVLWNKELIKSFDLVEYNPMMDKDNITRDIAINILNKIIKNM